DRFSLENANEVVLGKSGAGKSYLIKLEIMRQFMLGAEIIVVDPEGEYHTLTQTLGGEVVTFSANAPIKINPFDLSDVYEEGENQLGLKILSLHGLLKIILGELDAEHEAMLDKALIQTYQQKGITPDPASQKQDPPIMEDLYKVLLGYENAAGRELAYRLEKFVKGSAAGIFNQKSNFELTNPLTIFDIKNLEEELRPIAMHIILDFVWTKVKKTLKRRVLVLDEAWYMMKYQDSASFVYSIAKRARKYYLGLTTATQDVEDFLSTDYGKAVLTNSSIQMLLKQSAAGVDLVSKTFYLTEGEKELLLSADIGEGLFFAGQNHVAAKVLAAPFEHELITSNPQELIKQQQLADDISAQNKKEIAADPLDAVNKFMDTIKNIEPAPTAQAPMPPASPKIPTSSTSGTNVLNNGGQPKPTPVLTTPASPVPPPHPFAPPSPPEKNGTQLP
ncbi:MAG: VirB4 family type IV secretion system protein, partial [Rhabdochlamydiaceae bacterium]